MEAPRCGKALLDHFSALEDPRQAWKVVYPLPEILLVILCGTMAGAEDFVEIERWANRKLDFLRRLLPFERGIPSHDTFNDVMNALARRGVLGLLRVLGGGPARCRSRHRRHRRQDLAARPQPGQGSEPAASGLRLGDAPAARAGAAGLRGKVQRDHRHPGAAGAAGTDRRAGHHRRHGLPDRDRRSHPRPRRRLPACAEGQLARPLSRGRAFLRCRRIRPRSTRTRPPTATTAVSKAAAMPSATMSNGSSPTGAFPASGASRTSP